MIGAFTSRLAVSKHSETTDDDRFDMVVVCLDQTYLPEGNTASYLGFNNADTRNELKACRHPAVDFYFTILACLLYKNYYNK